MKTTGMAFLAGIIFAVGLVISEMTKPDKVIGFLDLAGSWDPSLAFVMVGAIGVHAVTYRVITQRNTPVWSEAFHIPTRQDFDGPLVVGAVLFGAGWALGGFCPGPAIASVASAALEVGVFVLCMLAGMGVHGLVRSRV